MRSGDFSGLASVYAADATLKQLNPQGKTVVAHGIAEITAVYKGLYAKFAGFQWTREELRSLSKNVVLLYEHAGSPPLSVPGRCIHIAVVEHGMIRSFDWATFYGGQP